MQSKGSIGIELEPGPASASIAGQIGFAFPDDLNARIRGVPKAVTYHDLQIVERADYLEITLILDV